MTSLTAPTAMADQVKLYAQSQYSSNGGEYTLSVIDNAAGPDLDVYLNQYDSKTKNINYLNSFETFCLERTEFFSPGTLYNVAISDRAVSGGIDLQNNVPGSDPLSKGTAWLYREFLMGRLAGYDYDTGNGHRRASAAALQEAIWWLEDEMTLANPANNKFISLLGFMSDPKTDNDGLYPVAVLNIYGLDGNFAQDQPVSMVHSPEPAAMLLFASGFLGFAEIVRRKLKKQL